MVSKGEFYSVCTTSCVKKAHALKPAKDNKQRTQLVVKYCSIELKVHTTVAWSTAKT